MRALLLALTLALALAQGCATHVPPNALSAHRYEALPWAADLDAAVVRGLAEHKPVLLILVSGSLTGFC